MSENSLPSLMTALDALTLDADFSLFFKKAATAVQHILDADGTALILLDESGDFFEYKLFEGERETLLSHFRGMRFPSSEGVAGRTLRARQSIFVEDYSQDPDAMPALIQAGLRTNLIIPLMNGERVIGVLASSWFDERNPQVSPRTLALRSVLPIKWRWLAIAKNSSPACVPWPIQTRSPAFTIVTASWRSWMNTWRAGATSKLRSRCFLSISTA